jgi:cyanophycin synthetase
MSFVKLDPIACAVRRAGLSPDAVPLQVSCLIRRNANLSTGGSAIDVTDEVHPTVAEQAVDAARVIGLDIAGVDIICQDIRQPLNEQVASFAK